MDSQNDISKQNHDAVGGQQGNGIGFPVHAFVLFDSADFINHIVHMVKHGIREGVFASRNMIDINAHWNDHYQINENGQYELHHSEFLL